MAAPTGTTIWSNTSIILVSRNLLNSGTRSKNTSVNHEASLQDNTMANSDTANRGQRSQWLPAMNHAKHKANAKAPK